MKPEAVTRLEELIAAAPIEPPFGQPADCWCALNRARFVTMSGKYQTGSLSSYAMTLGFTKSESYGIMHGWDEAAQFGNGAFRNERGSRGFAEGETLGRALFAKYGAPL